MSARLIWAGVLASLALLRTLAAQPSPTAITDRLRTKFLRPIDFHAAIFPDTVWVGQQATYQVAVLLNADARGRLRRNPEFLPPELRGLLAYELGTPQRVPPRSYGTDTYEAHVFQRALFAVAPGTVVVPSPQLTYSLPQSASYFSREERYSVAAESAQLVVKPLPEDGRPADFSGAIGAFRVSARLDSVSARVGDPLVLTLRVEGTGNVKLLPRPAVEIAWASTVDGTERVQVDSSGAYVRGAKEFEYILTPAEAGPQWLPAVRYAYFDPFKGAYAVASTQATEVRIADGAMAGGAVDSPESDLLPLRPWRRQLARRVTTLPDWVILGAGALAVLLPLAALADAVQRRRTRRPAPVPAAMTVTSEQRAAAERTPGGIARRVRRTLLASLAQRLHVAPADLAARDDVQRILRRRGVTRDTTQMVLTLLDELAVAGFGRDQAPPADFEARADRALQAVQAEAVSHGRTRLWTRRGRRVGSTLLLLVAGGALLDPRPAWAANNAQDRNPARAAGGDEVRTNTEATEAYAARRFARAATRYAELVARRPDDADLLMNWGTAAWAANDTVAAVVAWQRAARLEPLAQDVQERLTLLPAGARVGVADVPMIPVLWLAGAAVLLWVAAWGVWLWGVQRRDVDGRARARPTAVLLLVGAVAAAGLAAWGAQALDVARLAVVRRPETLRVAPAASANPMGGAATGDVVRRLASQQGWEEVEHADGRRGWIPAARLVSLANPLLDTDRAR